MMGETIYVPKRNLEVFVDGIKRDGLEFGHLAT
jgi:hypothetical protein